MRKLLCSFVIFSIFILSLGCNKDSSPRESENLKFKALHTEFLVQKLQSDLTRAHTIADSLLLIANQSQNDSLLILARLSKCSAFINGGKLAPALSILADELNDNLAIEKFESLSYTRHLYLSVTYHKLGEFEKSFKELEMCENFKLDVKQKVKVYSNWAATLITAKQYPKAIDKLIVADKLLENSPVSYDHFLIAANLARVLHNTENYKNSIKYLLKERDLINHPALKKYGLEKYIGGIYNDLSYAYIFMDSLHRAKVMLDSATVRNANNLTNKGVTHLRKSMYFGKLDSTRIADSERQKALLLFKESENAFFTLAALKAIMKAKFESNDFSHVKQYIDDAYGCCGKFVSLEDTLLLNKYNFFADLKGKIPNDKFLAAIENDKLTNEYFGVSHQDELAKLQEEFESDKRDNEINKLNIQNELTEARSRNYFLIAIVFGLMAGLSILFFVREILNRRRISKQKSLIQEVNSGLERKNQEVQLLNRELSHRVKNNLEFISSLLKLQSRELKDAGSKEALKDSENRIQALSSVYKRLYGDDGIVPINLQEYLTELTDNLKETYQTQERELKIEMHANELLVPAEKATKIGLIVNELVTNSIKYAFQDQSDPVIKVAFQKNNEELQLHFSDNGIGTSNTMKDEGREKSFGLGLVEKLVKQLSGNMQTRNDDGLTYEFSFKGFN